MDVGGGFRVRGALASVIAAIGLVAIPAAANAAASWQEGPLVESQNIDCITGEVTPEAGSYLSYYADATNPPQVGQVYYIAVDLSGIGDPCPGIYAAVNLAMPPGTAPAISAQNPVKCFMNLGNGWGSVGQYCPQSLPLGPYGYEVDPVNYNPPFWPLAAGTFIEIRIPVVSTQPLDGTSQLRGYIQLADGQDNPVLTPGLSVIVDKAAAQTGGTGTGSQQIAVYYSNPSITGQQDVSVVQNNTTYYVEQASYTAWVQNNSNSGIAYPQVAYADSSGSCANPTNILVNPTPPTSNTYATPMANLQIPNTKLTGTLDLYRDVAYCWRIVTHVAGTGAQAGTYYGNWEYFVTNGAYVPYSQEPPAATPPPAGIHCSTSGGGCQSSNCTTQCTTALSPGQTLTVSPAGSGSGSVTDGRFISCPLTCSATYANGAKLTLTAKPAPGSNFAGWSGGGCSGTGTCTVTMNAAQAVSAIFNALPSGGGGGTGGNGGGSGGNGGGSGGTSGSVLRSIGAVLHQTLKSAILDGVIFNVGCAAACRVTIRLFLDGATAGRLHLALDARARRKQRMPLLVGSATITLSGAGSKRISVKLSRSARHAFSRLNSVKLTASALATGSRGTSLSKTFTLILHR